MLSDLEAWPRHLESVDVVALLTPPPMAIGSRSRLTLTLDMRGAMVPIVALFFRGLTNSYMTTEAQGLKRAAGPPRHQKLIVLGFRADPYRVMPDYFCGG